MTIYEKNYVMKATSGLTYLCSSRWPGCTLGQAFYEVCTQNPAPL